MIYNFEVSTINASKDTIWSELVQTVKALPMPDFITSCTSSESMDEELVRTANHHDIGMITEKIKFYPDKGKIVASIVQHNLYYGQTIYQLIYPEDNALNMRKTGLAVMIVWHMHAGIIEAAHIDKIKFLQSFIDKIKSKVEIT